MTRTYEIYRFCKNTVKQINENIKLSRSDNRMMAENIILDRFVGYIK